MRHLTRLLLTSIALFIGVTFITPAPAYAQLRVKMQNRAVANGNGDSLPTSNQATATFTVNCTSCGGGTTVNFEGTNNGSDYTAITGTLAGTTTTATSTTSASTQVWIFSVSGFLNVRARIAAYSAGTVTVEGLVTPTGGGGAGSSSSGTVAISSGGNTAAVNGDGTLSVNCANCTGSGASKVDNSAFTFGTTAIAPVGYVLDDVATNAATENSVALARMSSNRVAYGIIRDGALNERAANVTATNELNVTPGFAGTVASTGNGATGAQTQRVTLSNDSTGILAQVTLVPTVTTVGAVTAITNALPAGTNNIGKVDIPNALPAGTNLLGKADIQFAGSTPTLGNGLATGATMRVSLASDSTGQVAIASPATLGVYVEDSPETAAGNLMMSGSVRRDTAASSAGTTGDNATINTDAVGALWANIATPATIGVYVEDAAETAGGNLMMAGTVRRDAAATSASTSGDNATLNTDALGRLWVNCGTGCSGGTQYNIDTAAGSTDTGTIALAMRKDSLATLTPVDGDWVQLRVNSTGALWVQNALIDAANNATVTTNPVPIGGVYATSPTALTDGQVGYPLLDTGHRFVVAGAGTAGSAAGGVLTVQGAGSMTPFLDNPGTATLWGIYVEDAAETAGGNLMMAGSVRRDTAAASSTSSGDNSTLNTDALGLVWARHLDPCSGVAKVSVPFTFSTATTTQLVAASASNKVYICSINLVTAAANNVAVIEDDTSACASPTAGMAGGTSAATGWNFGANGGISQGNGDSSIMVTAATNRYVCLISSAATQTSGNITYVLAP